MMGFVKEWVAVSKVKLDGHPKLLKTQDIRAQRNAQEIVNEMASIVKMVQDGTMSFLFAEYTVMAVYIVLFSEVLIFFTGVSMTLTFVVGAVTPSCAVGSAKGSLPRRTCGRPTSAGWT